MYAKGMTTRQISETIEDIYGFEAGEGMISDITDRLLPWSNDYPNAMKSWYTNWDVISPIFKFSQTVRKVIYTTNAIESLNSGFRRLNKQRSVFPVIQL